MPGQIFISYAHEDNVASDPLSKRWLDRLLQQLAPLQAQRLVDAWSDERIQMGGHWQRDIEASLQNAVAAVLLVSPAFLASEYIRNSELPVLLKRAKDEGLVIVPIILNPCHFKRATFKYPDPQTGPDEFLLSSLQAAHAPDKELSGLSEHEQGEILLSVAERLLEIVQQSRKTPPVPTPAPVETPPALEQTTPQITLPPPPAGFVGRTELLAELRQGFERGGVTILRGEGGVGKTALALHFVHSVRDSGELPGGIAWINCELKPNRDECLHQMALQFFGDRLEQEPIAQCEARVREHWRSEQALAIFDNFETVADDGELVAWLAQVRSPARALVTTRQPPSGSERWSQPVRVEELKRHEAVQLFEERARAAGWDGQGQELVAELCEAVGDLPLAIELLAPQAAELPLPELRQMAHRSLHALAAEDPTRPERQRSIDACFRVSFERLDGAARQLLTRLSVLPDGASTSIIGPFTRIEAWQKPIAQCVRHSLLRLEEGRYRFHPLLRRFALAQLGDEAPAWQSRFVDYFQQWVMDNGGLMHQLTKAKLAVLDAEWRNALAAAEVAEELEEWEAVGYLSSYLVDFLLLRGLWSQCEQLSKRAAEAARAAGDRQNEGIALNNLGMIYDSQGKWAEAEAAYQQSLAIKRELGDRMGEGRTLNNLGLVYQSQGKWAEAEAAYQQSLAICREFDNRVGEGKTLNNLGLVYQSQGKWGEAEAAFQQSLIICREFDDRVGEGPTLNNLGLVYQSQGKW
ncbi:MAG: tetratricopeptide repeat protein, partial [Armatimonadota bacterium]|nr:tetratricopeptide repeat protein [Armatimonadota bacterium]